MLEGRRIVSFVLTLVFILAALWAARQVWVYYMHSPWTRDGRVRVDVVNMGTDVPGLVDKVMVKDNSFVQQGDVLFTIDHERYELALAEARANLERQKQLALEAENVNARRQKLNKFASQEDREHAYYSLNAARAAVEQAEIALRTAQLNMQRATVRSPVDGYVTNLLLRPGEYVNEGDPTITLIDASSYYLVGYFEETKLDKIRVGDRARIRLLSYPEPVFGHVDSIARGIVDNSLYEQSGGLMAVNPSFDWVRLSQRIPVYIRLDEVPEQVALSAGLTATIYLGQFARQDAELPEWRQQLKDWWEQLVSL